MFFLLFSFFFFHMVMAERPEAGSLTPLVPVVTHTVDGIPKDAQQEKPHETETADKKEDDEQEPFSWLHTAATYGSWPLVGVLQAANRWFDLDTNRRNLPVVRRALERLQSNEGIARISQANLLREVKEIEEWNGILAQDPALLTQELRDLLPKARELHDAYVERAAQSRHDLVESTHVVNNMRTIMAQRGGTPQELQQRVDQALAAERQACFRNEPVKFLLYTLAQQLAAEAGYAVTRDLVKKVTGENYAKYMDDTIKESYRALFVYLVTQQRILSARGFAAFAATDVTYLGGKKIAEHLLGQQIACPALKIPTRLRTWGLSEKTIERLARFGSKYVIKQQFDKLLNVHDVEPLMFSWVTE